MKSYTFRALGHENITAKHKTTLEFTKDSRLTLKGDCIVGVNADFNLKKLKSFKKKVLLQITVNNLTEEITGDINPSFNHDTELVIRTSGYASPRTFIINADKAANDLRREFVEELKKSKIYSRTKLIEC